MYIVGTMFAQRLACENILAQYLEVHGVNANTVYVETNDTLTTSVGKAWQSFCEIHWPHKTWSEINWKHKTHPTGTSGKFRVKDLKCNESIYKFEIVGNKQIYGKKQLHWATVCIGSLHKENETVSAIEIVLSVGLENEFEKGHSQPSENVDNIHTKLRDRRCVFKRNEAAEKDATSCLQNTFKKKGLDAPLCLGEVKCLQVHENYWSGILVSVVC